MKFLHLGDLHIGKRLNNISLLEDQRYILGQILDIAREEQPDAVLIAGDVYDRTLPPAEAVTLLDDFLTALAAEAIPVFLISGNHDSAERLAFGGRLLSEGGVYLSPVYDGELTPHLLEDEYGTVAVWLLPFIRPAHVRAVYPDAEITSYTQAVQTALAQAAPAADRQVLVAHQFVTGATPGGSEEFAVGGVENVDASVFDAFDYVALGHLHTRPSRSGPPPPSATAARPLAYSLSPGRTPPKRVAVAGAGQRRGRRQCRHPTRSVPWRPLRELTRQLRLELTLAQHLAGRPLAGGLPAGLTLTAPQEIPDAAARLRVHLSRISCSCAYRRCPDPGIRRSPLPRPNRHAAVPPESCLGSLYARQNGQPMDARQEQFARTTDGGDLGGGAVMRPLQSDPVRLWALCGSGRCWSWKNWAAGGSI